MKKLKSKHGKNVQQLAVGLGLVVIVAVSLAGFKKIQDLIDVRVKAREYVQTHIMPVILAERKLLEVELSPSERSHIQELRERMKELHPRRRDDRTELRTPQWDPVANRERRQEMNEILTLAEDIISDHIQTIENSFSNLRKLRPQWKEEIESLAGHELSNHHGGRMMGGVLRHLGKHKHVRFLLLDPEMDPTQMGVGPHSRVYPNPTLQNSTLEYEVKEQGQVSIQVMDQDGRALMSPYRGIKQPGMYQFEIDVSRLADGVYLYSVSTPSGTETGRIIKGK